MFARLCIIWLSFQLEAYIDEAATMEKEAAIFHNSKIPKSLLRNEDLARMKSDKVIS